jgi:prolyl 4-hydroxylase
MTNSRFEKKEDITTTATITLELSKSWKKEDCKVHVYEQNNIWTVSNMLSEKECISLIEQSEKLGYDSAPINVGGGQQIMMTDLRDNKRTIWDDTRFAEQLFERVKHFVPQECTKLHRLATIGKEFELCGCNERFRFYRYENGERFNPHFDGHFDRKVARTYEKSFLTCITYLNDVVGEGGETNFLEHTHRNEPVKFGVKPKRGVCLFFVHAGNLHEGAAIPIGSSERKYVIRTDIMYKKQL